MLFTMDKTLKRLVKLIKHYNPKTRKSDVIIKRPGREILLIIRGPQARYMSNALYHLMRALGRRNVRRWICNSDWCVSFSA